MLLIIFLLTGSLMIISNNNLYMSNLEDRQVFKGMFVNWILGMRLNMLNINGFVIEQAWMPGNNLSDG